MDLRNSTNIVTYAQSKDILRQAEDELIKHKTGVYKNGAKRLRKLLLTLCRIELKCPTLKRQCDKLLDEIFSEILNLRNNRLSIESNAQPQPLSSSSLPLNCATQTSPIIRRQSPICNEGECSYFINDKEKNQLENVQPSSELHIETMSIAGLETVNDQENVEQSPDSFQQLEKMSVTGSQSIFLDYNMSQVHATYFSNENSPEIPDHHDSLKECPIQAQSTIIDSAVNMSCPETTQMIDNCTQVEEERSNQLCLYNSQSATSSNHDYLQFTETEVTQLSQRLNIDEIDFYQIMYEIREDNHTPDQLEQQMILGNISPQHNNILEELASFVDESSFC